MFYIGVLLLVEVIYHRQIQAIGQPMANLGGPAVDGLLSGKDNVEAADFPDGRGQCVRVSQVSPPPKARELSRYASSAPMARHSRSMLQAWGGPMESTATVEAGFASRRVSAVFSAFKSSGFTFMQKPAHRQRLSLGMDFYGFEDARLRMGKQLSNT